EAYCCAALSYFSRRAIQSPVFRCIPERSSPVAAFLRPPHSRSWSLSASRQLRLRRNTMGCLEDLSQTKIASNKRQETYRMTNLSSFIGKSAGRSKGGLFPARVAWAGRPSSSRPPTQDPLQREAWKPRITLYGRHDGRLSA